MVENPVFIKIISVSILLSLTITAGLAVADPIGDLPEFNESGEQLMGAHGKSRADIEKEIPSRVTVGLPVYPGALYTGKMEADGMLPTVIMVSGDPIEKVQEWYASQEGLSYHDTYATFYVGDDYVKTESETVFLQDISDDPSASFSGFAFDMEGMKTQFSISYKPKEDSQ
jgi:hypothetical protein